MITKTDMCFIIDKIDSLNVKLPIEAEEIISDIYVLFAHELYEYYASIISDYDNDKNDSDVDIESDKQEYDNTRSYSENNDDVTTIVGNTKKRNTRKNTTNSVASQYKKLME